MAVVKESVAGLANILSEEKLPRRPALRTMQHTVELEKWIENLENYLRRQFGRFTAELLASTIDNGGVQTGLFQIVLDRWFLLKPNHILDTLLSAEDWRGRGVYAAKSDPQAYPSASNAWYDYNSFILKVYGYNVGPQTIISTGTGTVSLLEVKIDASGHLILHTDTTGEPTDIDVRVLCIATERKTVSDATL